MNNIKIATKEKEIRVMKVIHFDCGLIIQPIEVRKTEKLPVIQF